MKRRQFIRGSALLGALGLAGCTGQATTDDSGSGGPSDPTDTDAPTESPTATDTPLSTPTEPLTVDPTDTSTPTTMGTSTAEPRTTTPTPTPTATPAGTAIDDETKTPAQVGDGTPTPTPAMPDAVSDHSFTVTERTCGQQTDSASVAVADDGTVTVTGTIWGSDACQSARLQGLEVDDDTLTVRVVEYTEDDGMCAQCITEIDYENTATLDSGAPGTVVVTHDHGDGPKIVAKVSTGE